MVTLDEFLTRPVPARAWVTEPGFDALYVRLVRRNGVQPVLDIANVKATNPGTGAFTRLVERVLALGIPVYVQGVSPRFARKLERMGFIPSDFQHSYFKTP
jgi:NAD(P)H-dependent flavin oxidoreductase YrpB (nitropropane dioxygenase family)